MTDCCRCFLCWLVSWVTSRLSDPVALPAALPETLEECARTWSTRRIGELMCVLQTAAMAPGGDREASLHVLASVLREREEKESVT